VCGTFQSSLVALAKLALTIFTAGLLVKCPPKAVIMAFFLARKVGLFLGIFLKRKMA